jgi:LCP family protein required for cell wall assembly
MKFKTKILYIFPTLILILFLFFFTSSKTLLINNFTSFLSSDDFAVLILGKPGAGYIGSENTDSIALGYYSKKYNKVFLIFIPRDLVVKNDSGELEKINALYGAKKMNTLLNKVEDFTGIKVKNYVVVDLNLIKSLVDFLGGLEVELDEPVTDAITLYTLNKGKHVLNGDLIELVLRSRYNSEGDFFRQGNQAKVLKALKDKVASLSLEEKVNLIKFLDSRKYDWQTNLSKQEIFNLFLKIKDIQSLSIEPIIFKIRNGLLASGYFDIYNSKNVYGIYPKAGIDNYDKIRFYIKSIIK